MIFGNCPYCDEHMSIGMPDDLQTPVLALLDCEHCGKEFYEKMSRIDPEAYRIDDIEIRDNKVYKVRGVLV